MQAMLRYSNGKDRRNARSSGAAQHKECPDPKRLKLVRAMNMDSHASV